MIVFYSSNEILRKVVLFADFFKFLVTFIMFNFCRSAVLELKNFDMKLSSLRSIFGLSSEI